MPVLEMTNVRVTLAPPLSATWPKRVPVWALVVVAPSAMAIPPGPPATLMRPMRMPVPRTSKK